MHGFPAHNVGCITGTAAISYDFTEGHSETDAHHHPAPYFDASANVHACSNC
jgi:hypothetical protein